jgi:hypothetical protein
LIEKESGKRLENLSESFKDYGIRNNDTLVLREPPKGRQEGDEEEEENDE